jgi:hypothetical protein
VRSPWGAAATAALWLAAATATPTPSAAGGDPGAALAERARRLALTRDVPSTLRGACTELGRRLRREGSARAVLCPSLVPAGPLRVAFAGPLTGVRPGRPGRSYMIDVHSPQLPDQRSGGHWLVASGTRSGLRLAGLVDLAPTAVRTLRLAGVFAVVREMPPYPRGGVNGGHVLVEWHLGANTHLVSVHGHRNRERALLMAEAMIRAARGGA